MGYTFYAHVFMMGAPAVQGDPEHVIPLQPLIILFQ